MESVIQRTTYIKDKCSILSQAIPPDSKQQQRLRFILLNANKIEDIVTTHPRAATPDLLQNLTTCLNGLNAFHEACTQLQGVARHVVSVARQCWIRHDELQPIEELLWTCYSSCVQIQNADRAFAATSQAPQRRSQNTTQKPPSILMHPEPIPWVRATQRKAFTDFSKGDEAVQHEIKLLSLKFDALEKSLVAMDLTSLGSATSIEDEANDILGLQYLLFKDDLGACTGLRTQLVQIAKLMQSSTAIQKARTGHELGKLARILAQLDLHDRALSIVKWQIKIYRAVHLSDTTDLNLELAWSLIHLSACLIAQYRPRDALKAAQEAVEISRKHASNEIQPEASRSTLVCSLTQMSVCLVCLGRINEGLRSAEDALVICKPLIGDRLTVAPPDLAECLMQYSCCLRLGGRDNEALAAIKEAVDYWQNLVRDRGEAYMSALARALGYLAICAQEVGPEADARQAAEEAVRTWGVVAEVRPSIAGHGLAQSLIHFSTCLTGEEALNAIEDAVDIYLGLSELKPAIYEPYLVVSLYRLSIQHEQMGREHECSNAIDKAVEIVRKLATHPQIGGTNEASQPSYVFTCLVNTGYKHEAVKLLLEGQVVDQTPFQLYPITAKPTLALSVVYLTFRTSKLGSNEERVKAVQDLANEWVKRDEICPNTTEPGFGIFLLHLSLLLDSMGRPDVKLQQLIEHILVRDNLPALTPSPSPTHRPSNTRRENTGSKAIEVATKIHRRLSLNGQTVSKTGLMLSLHLFSLHTLNQGDQGRSWALIAEAIDCYDMLRHDPRQLFRPQNAQLLSLLSAYWFRAGKFGESLKYALMVMTSYWRLAGERKDIFLPYLLLSQVTLAICYAAREREANAFSTMEEVSLPLRELEEDRPMKQLIRHELKELERHFQELHWERHLTYVQSMLA